MPRPGLMGRSGGLLRWRVNEGKRWFGRPGRGLWRRWRAPWRDGRGLRRDGRWPGGRIRMLRGGARRHGRAAGMTPGGALGGQLLGGLALGAQAAGEIIVMRRGRAGGRRTRNTGRGAHRSRRAGRRHGWTGGGGTRGRGWRMGARRSLGRGGFRLPGGRRFWRGGRGRLRGLFREARGKRRGPGHGPGLAGSLNGFRLRGVRISSRRGPGCAAQRLARPGRRGLALAGREIFRQFRQLAFRNSQLFPPVAAAFRSCSRGTATLVRSVVHASSLSPFTFP